MPLRDLLRSARRRLGLSPMQRILRELTRRNIDLKNLQAIELFGGMGKFHTLDYAHRVGSMEIWEIDPRLEAPLRHNLPSAKIRITDTYAELKNASKRYDLIVCDNPMSLYGSNDQHCEHFGLFPDIFSILADRAILILNVIPSIDARARRRFPYLFNEHQLAARAQFYGTGHPGNIPLESLIDRYTHLAAQHGYTVNWHFTRQRHFVWYLVIELVVSGQ